MRGATAGHRRDPAGINDTPQRNTECVTLRIVELHVEGPGPGTAGIAILRRTARLVKEHFDVRDLRVEGARRGLRPDARRGRPADRRVRSLLRAPTPEQREVLRSTEGLHPEISGVPRGAKSR